ncbi:MULTISPECIES: hypothetical protein [unclassified Paenibacillus]|uniref:hypothetical protein n=1 Tax=unclassified Paenibacillus TaxID=185978 RepID=UPI002788E537|nr:MULTISPECIES: hypothetical protein [unclassified Paenibacillus]MDQ0896251.1 formate dehydrogenase maturation protein FdhE [Paenibacillus sp. V4I7]MDQ0913821.1 formate dehydrogenase maturation protein FdhE [Paenibacillus sp. V4I5]
MKLIDLEKLEVALAEDRIGFQEVADQLFNKSTKPWQTAEWKKRREELLKDHCEQCNKKEGTKVIQHFWHPQDYSSIQYPIVGRYIDEYFDRFLIENNLLISELTEKRWVEEAEEKQLCPNCSSINFTERKTKTPRYRCNKCKDEFDEPVIGKLIGLSTKDDFQSGFARKFINEKIWQTFEEKIRKEAILESISQHKKYISFEGTKTYCSKCAFLWDKKGMKLCDKCKTKYHNKGRTECSECR